MILLPICKMKLKLMVVLKLKQQWLLQKKLIRCIMKIDIGRVIMLKSQAIHQRISNEKRGQCHVGEVR